RCRKPLSRTSSNSLVTIIVSCELITSGSLPLQILNAAKEKPRRLEKRRGEDAGRIRFQVGWQLRQDRVCDARTVHSKPSSKESQTSGSTGHCTRARQTAVGCLKERPRPCSRRGRGGRSIMLTSGHSEASDPSLGFREPSGLAERSATFTCN